MPSREATSNSTLTPPGIGCARFLETISLWKSEALNMSINKSQSTTTGDADLEVSAAANLEVSAAAHRVVCCLHRVSGAELGLRSGSVQFKCWSYIVP